MPRIPSADAESSVTANESLRIIAKTLALIALRMEPDKKSTLNDRAAFLSSVGFDTKTIADMLESSVPTIAPMLSRRKSQGLGHRKTRKQGR